MKKLFGTDGIRGTSNSHPITVEIALQLGKAAAKVFRTPGRRNRIVIGKDTRLSGYMLETALASGICSMGVDVLLVGPLPTPGIAFITKSLRADAGIVISASHNPYEDNGIKFFSKDGFKLPDETEHKIEELVLSGDISNSHVAPDVIGKAYRIDDADGRYIEFVKNTFPKGETLEGLKIVIDCANGAGYKVAPAVFEELGAEIYVINNLPNGKNINLNSGALYPEILGSVVKEAKADIGIALDGDADRLIVVDETGTILDGDHILGICGVDMIKKGTLPGNKLVATVMSNAGLEKLITDAGGTLLRAGVGDRYVSEMMTREQSVLGGEQSGHIIFRDFTTTGDGIISALQVLRILKQSGKKMSELAKILERFPQTLTNINVSEKKPIDQIPGLTQTIEQAQDQLGTFGRVLVRYSGTEKKLRVMVEGRCQEKLDEVSNQICTIIRKEIGV